MSPIYDVSYHIERITKKYIIDFLNALFFANSILWDSDDQFNQLPIIASSDNGNRYEMRGTLIVHRSAPKALRCTITAVKDTGQQVCYRLVNLTEPLRIDEKRGVYYPLDGAAIDFAISDLNLGVNDLTSYAFYDNIAKSGKISSKKLFTLMQFLINAHYISLDSASIYKDLVNDVVTYPPATCDPHYQPVFGVKHDDKNYWY